MQVIVDGLLTSYEQEGNGKIVVLLHGWGDSAAGMLGLRQALAKKFRVITLNLPGFSKSAPPPKPWALNEYVSFVAHFLEKIDADDIWAVVGHSNGGAVAIRGLGLGILQAERAVLLGCAGIRNEQQGRNRVLRFLAKTGKVVTLPLPTSVRQRLRRNAYKAIGSDMLVVEGLQETFKLIVADDVRADAAQLTMPTLLIYGEADEETPVWYGEQFRELIVNATLEILPGAGHFVHLDRPADVARAIEDFLR